MEVLINNIGEIFFATAFTLALYLLSKRVSHLERALKHRNGYKNYNPNKGKKR